MMNMMNYISPNAFRFDTDRNDMQVIDKLATKNCVRDGSGKPASDEGVRTWNGQPDPRNEGYAQKRCQMQDVRC